MAKVDLTIRRGAVIVFEGLDKTGKSTQLDRLRGSLGAVSTVFAHMPSGFSKFTERVYRALEGETPDEKPTSGLAQQLAQLACHAESVPYLKRAAETRSLVLDRSWWSTLAYGWFGGSVKQSGLPESSFKGLIDTIWSPIKPSIVFVFLEPRHLDPNNAPGVQDGYRALLKEQPESAVVLPVANEEETHSFVTQTLLDRGLTARVGNH